MKASLTFLTTLLLVGLATLLAVDTSAPPVSGGVFDIRSFGAVGDGKTLNTAAIQGAIDACHADGGGRVVVPAGEYLSGSVRLKSGVILKVETGATLRGSPQISDYHVETAPLHWGGGFAHPTVQWRQAFIYAENAEQIGLEGQGVIDGQGGRARRVFPNEGDTLLRRPMLIRFERCREVSVSHVTLINPASFTTFFVRSEGIRIEGVTVRSRNTPNGDALDFDGCRRVRIIGCDIDSGDDSIALKTFHPDWPNEDFEIRGCRITTRWHAIRVGCESIGAIRRLIMRDCVFTHCQGGIKIESCEGAQIEDLLFTNIEMKQICQPFMVLASRFAFSAHNRTSWPPVGRIRNVRFANIKAVAGIGEDVGRVNKPGRPAANDPFERLCSAVVSLPGTSIEGISFIKVDLAFPGGGTAAQAARLDVAELLESSDYTKWAIPFDGELPASALYLRHVKGVRLEEVRLSVQQPDARTFVVGDDVEGLTLQGVTGHAPASVPGLAKLSDVKDVNVRDCRVECGAPAPILVAPSTEELRRLAELRSRTPALDREAQLGADRQSPSTKEAANRN